MIKGSENKMMSGAPSEKSLTRFHFAGDGIWRPMAILAETIEEAEKLWHEGKILLSKPPNPPPAKEEVIVKEEVKVEEKQPSNNL